MKGLQTGKKIQRKKEGKRSSYEKQKTYQTISVTRIVVVAAKTRRRGEKMLNQRETQVTRKKLKQKTKQNLLVSVSLFKFNHKFIFILVCTRTVFFNLILYLLKYFYPYPLILSLRGKVSNIIERYGC